MAKLTISLDTDTKVLDVQIDGQSVNDVDYVCIMKNSYADEDSHKYEASIETRTQKTKDTYVMRQGHYLKADEKPNLQNDVKKFMQNKIC